MARVKECSQCQKALPLKEFYNRSDGLYGKHKTCKECFKNYYNGSRSEPVEIADSGIKIMGCHNCVFLTECHDNIWRKSFDPYCFVTAKYHGLYVQEYSPHREVANAA